MCSLFGSSDQARVSDKDKQATVSSLQDTVAVMEREVITTTPEPTKMAAFPTMVKLPEGLITGRYFYPTENVPPLRVVAINVETGEFFSTEVFDDTIYVLKGLPIGTYHVMAYPVDPSQTEPGMAGGYTRAVPCGLETNCTDHSLLPVEVKSGEKTVDINPADWSAPAWTFPADPTK
jgi:hypothetical protein